MTELLRIYFLHVLALLENCFSKFKASNVSYSPWRALSRWRSRRALKETSSLACRSGQWRPAASSTNLESLFWNWYMPVIFLRHTGRPGKDSADLFPGDGLVVRLWWQLVKRVHVVYALGSATLAVGSW